VKIPPFFQTLRTRYANSQRERRALIHAGSETQSRAKRAIFALHRGDIREAERLLQEAAALLKTMAAKARRFPELEDEGSYRAALEEYVEAVLFSQYVTTGHLRKGGHPAMEPYIFFGALSDATGEMVRYATVEATRGNFEKVARAHETVEMVVGFLLELDLTGSLRQKFDQAKRNLRSLEEILYDVRLKRRGL
jgi:predicted translin family RNA/ssDNA-binding protein